MILNRFIKSQCIFFIIFLYFTAFPFVCNGAELKVGLLLPLTGKLASVGSAVRDGALMAVDEINQTGGIAGHRLHAVTADTRSLKGSASRAAENLIATPGVLMLAGGCASSAALAAGLVAEQREVPFLVTTAADDRITEQGWRYVFRLNAPASEYTAALEEYLAGHVGRHSTAAVIFERSPFGEYGLKRFMRLQRRLGFRIISRVGYQTEKEDFQDEIARIKEAAADIVCFVSSAEHGAAILKQAALAGLEAEVFLAGSRELLSPDFGRLAGDAADGLVGAAWWSPHVPYPGVNMFRENFLRRYGDIPTYHSAQGYSAMWVAADAIERAEGLNPKAVRAAMEDTRLMTVYGPVRFEAYGRKRQQNRVPSLAVRWDNGVLRIMRPRNLAAAS